MYFINEEGEVHHATIISQVSNGEIFYSGNTVRRYNQRLEDSLNSNYGVYIVRIKDELNQNNREEGCIE